MGGRGLGIIRALDRTLPRNPIMSTATYQVPELGIARRTGDFFAKPPMYL